MINCSLFLQKNKKKTKKDASAELAPSLLERNFFLPNFDHDWGAVPIRVLHVDYYFQERFALIEQKATNAAPRSILAGDASGRSRKQTLRPLQQDSNEA